MQWYGIAAIASLCLSLAAPGGVQAQDADSQGASSSSTGDVQAADEAAPGAPAGEEEDTGATEEDEQETEEPAADTVPAITIDDLRAPAAPAFVLLGVAPSAVERPETPKEVAVSVLSAAADGDFLPDNYALQVAPYWLGSNRRLTYEDYYEANVGQSILQTLSLSLATSRRAAEDGEEGAGKASGEVAGTGLGLGLRTMIFPGTAHPQLKAQREVIQKTFETMLGLIVASEQEGLSEAKRKELDAEYAKKKKELKELGLKIRPFETQRVGFQLEVAGGLVVDFPENDFDNGELTRWGLWATPSYRFHRKEGRVVLDALGVVRYIHQQVEDLPADEEEPEPSQFDLGGRLVWMLRDDLALSLEAVRRFAGKPAEDSNRLVAIAEYQVRDDAYVFLSFGQDFEPAEGDDNLVSILGLRLGFGEQPSVTIPAAASTKTD